VREKGPRFTRCDIFKITVQFFFFNGAVKTKRGFSWGERLFFDGERAKPVDGLKETRFVFFIALWHSGAAAVSHVSVFLTNVSFPVFLDKTAKTAKIDTHA
jgi:hypothetical protein